MIGLILVIASVFLLHGFYSRLIAGPRRTFQSDAGYKRLVRAMKQDQQERESGPVLSDRRVRPLPLARR